jgi:hypothetical protein
MSDPYDVTGEGDFGDYCNEFMWIVNMFSQPWRPEHTPMTKAKLAELLKQRPLQTIQERFGKYPENMEVLSKYPAKIERIDKLAKLANKCLGIITFKRIVNELLRLLYGKDVELVFPEPRANPDLLKI